MRTAAALAFLAISACHTTEPAPLEATLTSSATIPPAGVRIAFSLLQADGRPIPSDGGPPTYEIVNDVTGRPFDSEGAYAPYLARPSDFQLYAALALDLSDSIFNKSPDGSAVQHAADSLIDILDSQNTSLDFRYRTAVYVFGSTVNSGWLNGGLFLQDNLRLKGSVSDALGFGRRGGTNLYGAYVEMLSQLHGRLSTDGGLIDRSAILVTDGTDTAATKSLQDALIELNRGDVTVYVVGIKGDIDESVLRQLASDPAKYVSVESLDQLAEALTTIANDIVERANQNHVIGLCSPVETGQASVTLHISFRGTSTSLDSGYNTFTRGWTGDVSRCGPRAAAFPPAPMFTVSTSENVGEILSSGGRIYVSTVDRQSGTGRLLGSMPDGGFQPLATGLNFPRNVRVSDASLYWLESPGQGAGGTVRSSVPNGVPSTVLSNHAATSFALDQGRLYWTETDGGVAGGSVWTTQLDGGSSFPLATAERSPIGVLVANDRVFWVSPPTLDSTTGLPARDGMLVTEFTDGGSRQVIASSTEVRQVLSIAGSIYWTEFPEWDKLLGIPAFRGKLYAADWDGSHARAISDGVAQIALDDAGIVWTDIRSYDPVTKQFDTEGLIYADGLDGGSATLVGMHQPNPGSLAIDRDRVYWSNAPTFGRVVPDAGQVSPGVILEVPRP